MPTGRGGNEPRGRFTGSPAPLWQPGQVAGRDDEQARGYSALVAERDRAAVDRGRYEDLAVTRRGAATFGGEYRPGSAGRAVRGFVRRYGWRAYALPLLALITVVALLTMRDPAQVPRHPAPAPAPAPQQPAGRASAPAAGGNTTLKSDAPSANANETALASAALPPGPKFTRAGTGTFQVVKGTTKVIGHGPLHRYDIEVEHGITGINAARFAAFVDRTLADPRSWSGHGVSLQRVDSGPIDFHITLTSVLTVRKLCGYEIHVETSCFVPAGPNSPVNRVVIDDARWVRGATAYVGDLTAYRQYLINHEDGHALGHQHAHECLPGGLAPAMMQQTIGLRDAKTGKMCQANPWPYPLDAQGRVVKGAPGAEAPDTRQNSEFDLTGE